MFGLGKKKANPKYCPQCGGSGNIVSFETPEPLKGRILTGPDIVKKSPCTKCRGSGIIGIPEIENLSSEKLKKLIEGKTSDDLMELFKGKTASDIEYIIKQL